MSDLAKQDATGFAPANTMAELTDLWNNPDLYGAAVINEGQLEKEKERLIGVPFAITRVVYHSDFKKSDRGYITAEGLIGPAHMLKEAEDRGWIPEANLPLLYKPGEVVKFNDGSTGVRRQITKILHDAKLIDVGETVSSNEAKATVFDNPWTEWASFNQVGYENGTNDEKVAIPEITLGPGGVPLRILVFHGLRVSHMDDWDTDVYYLS